MPVIRNQPLRLSVDDVVRGWGPRREQRVTPAMRARIAGILDHIEQHRLLDPLISYRVDAVGGHGPNWVELRSGTRIESPLVTHRLRRASFLSLGVCTIGDALSKQASAWFAAGEPTRAVMLDEIGSLALYRLTDQFAGLMAEEAESMGLSASGALSPGEDGFDLRQQANVLQAAGGHEIDVQISGQILLLPRKSVSVVIGIGDKLPRWSQGESCARCASREHCPYRCETIDGAAAA